MSDYDVFLNPPEPNPYDVRLRSATPDLGRIIDVAGTAALEQEAVGAVRSDIVRAGVAVLEQEASGTTGAPPAPTPVRPHWVLPSLPTGREHVRTGIAVLQLEALGTVEVGVDEKVLRLTRRRREEDELLLLV